MRRRDARAQFWSAMRQLAKQPLVELLDPRPARHMVDRWAVHEETFPDAFWDYTWAITLLRHGPFPDAFEEFEFIRETMGPLWDWPIGHVDRWCAKYDLVSADLRADALITVSSFLYSSAEGPIIDLEGCPTSVQVYDSPARLIAEDIGLNDRTTVRFDRLLFTEQDIETLGALMQDRLERRDVAERRLRTTVDEVVSNAFERFSEDTVKRASTPDHYVEWFVRRRVLHEDIASITTRANANERALIKQRAVFNGIKEVAELLGLPPRDPGKPPL